MKKDICEREWAKIRKTKDKDRAGKAAKITGGLKKVRKMRLEQLLRKEKRKRK